MLLQVRPILMLTIAAVSQPSHSAGCGSSEQQTQVISERNCDDPCSVPPVEDEPPRFQDAPCNCTCVITATEAKPVWPPLSYEVFGEIGYYKLFTDKTTWDQARRICEHDGAHLMVVDSVEELGAIRQLLDRGHKVQSPTWANVFFIGMHDRDSEGHFFTVLGEDLGNGAHLKWWQNAPQNEKGTPYEPDSDCGIIHSSDLGIDDAACTALLPFICEIPFTSA